MIQRLVYWVSLVLIVVDLVMVLVAHLLMISVFVIGYILLSPNLGLLLSSTAMSVTRVLHSLELKLLLLLHLLLLLF